MVSRKTLFVLLLTVGVTQIGFAQTPAPTVNAATPTPPAIDGGTPHYLSPETPEQRAVRVGNVDPGLDPDPKQAYYRYGKRYHIEKYDNVRSRVVLTGGETGWGRPYGWVNVYREIYQRNDKYTWFWIEDREAAAAEEAQQQATEPTTKWPEESLKYFRATRSEFSPLTPPSAEKTISFVDSSDGLPKSGSWRNSLAVADMNGDGKADIIAPPERQGSNSPSVFLGDGKGHWKRWDATWPKGLNYGGVATGDFNKDGHMDIAFAVHLDGVHVFLGDGKGTFTESSAGLPRDFPTRRVVVTDVDHDGAPDIVAISEGPNAVDDSNPGKADYAKIRAYLNKNKGSSWVGINIPAKGQEVAGDWLSAGDFNGDAYPDFIASNIFYNGPDILYVSSGKEKWTSAADDFGRVIPLLAYHRANATGKFSSRKRDDALISYYRQWPVALDPKIVPKPPVEDIAGIDRLDFSGKEPKRVPVMRWNSPAHNPASGMGSGDFDGDGNLDVAFTIFESREVVILLGDGKGNFKKAEVSGVKLAPNPFYDLRVADVNGDGRPDLLIGYEAAGLTITQHDGSIHVYLNQGATHGALAAAK
jgi:hypothetical protein